MSTKRRKSLRWVRLDNAAKIYPASRRKNWSAIFRQSVTLHEDVDLEVLRRALKVTIKRFPTIAARLDGGMFWYYLEQLESPPEILPEASYPLTYMGDKEMRSCAFRVIVYQNRIAIELFHSLTDGTGALIFLKTLTAEYLEQKHGISIPCEHGILDRREEPKPEELEDSFPKYAAPVAASRNATNAWRVPYGERTVNGFLHNTCFNLSVEEAKRVAKERGITLTVLFSAIMMQALINLQKEKVPEREKRARIKLLIPVNLRSLFPSKTLRNFAMFTTPELNPKLGEYTFEEICSVIYHKMGSEITAKHMSTVIATNVKNEQNKFIRLIPLPIKNMVMKAIFDSVGEIKSCLSLSNLGQVKVPEIMNPYIKRMDFMIGIQATAPYNCAMLSFNDTIYINFIRNVREAALERHFYAVMQELGLHPTVESNNCEV